MSKQSDRLEKIKQALAQANTGGGNTYWRPQAGQNTIRVLPGVGEMGLSFWQEVGKHYIPGSRKVFTCPDFTFGELCPICEMVGSLYDAGDEESVKLAKGLGRRKQYWMNIIDRNSEDRGPQIYTPGVQVFNLVSALFFNPDYGDICDVEQGYDLVVSKEGTGLLTKYTVMPKRTPSPLSKDFANQWMDAAMDLSPVELSENAEEDEEYLKDEHGQLIAPVYVLPYARLKTEFEMMDLGTEEEPDAPFPEDEDNVEEESAPRRRRRSTSTSGKSTTSRRRNTDDGVPY